jgi:hypothetical protein
VIADTEDRPPRVRGTSRRQEVRMWTIHTSTVTVTKEHVLAALSSAPVRVLAKPVVRAVPVASPGNGQSGAPSARDEPGGEQQAELNPVEAAPVAPPEIRRQGQAGAALAPHEPSVRPMRGGHEEFPCPGSGMALPATGLPFSGGAGASSSQCRGVVPTNDGSIW